MNSTHVEQLFEPEEHVNDGIPEDAISLSDDPNMWPQELLAALVDSVGLPPGVIPTINLKPESDEGDANGSILLSAGSMRLVVPIIIRKQHAFPLDTFFIEGVEDSFRPLDAETFAEVMTRAGSGMMQVQDPGNRGLVASVVSGDSDLGGMSSPDGSSGRMSKLSSPSMLDELRTGGWIADEDVKGVADDLASRSSLLDSLVGMPKVADSIMRLMERNVDPPQLHDGCGCGSIDCIHAGKPDVAEGHAFNPSRLGTNDVFQIRLVGPGRFQLHATMARVYVPVVRELSSSEVRDLLEHLFSGHAARERHDVGEHVNALIQKLLRDGEITVSATSRSNKPDVLSPNKRHADDIATYGRYLVVQESGLQDRGLVFTDVFDLDGGQIPAVLFVSERTGNWSMQEACVGIGIGDGLPFTELRKWSAASEGNRVVCAWSGPAGSTLVSLPMEVERQERINGVVHICCLLNGQRVRLKFDDGISHPVSLSGPDAVDAEGRRTYLFPGASEFFLVGKQVQLVTSGSAFEKLSVEASATPSLVRRQSDGRYSIKIGSVSFNDMPRVDARLLLATCGADSTSSSEILEKSASGDVRLDGYLDEPIVTMAEVEKLAGAHLSRFRTEHGDRVAKTLVPMIMSGDVIKLAAGVGDQSVADRLIALRFLTPENLNVFKRYIPEIEACVSKLGKMLIFARATSKMDQFSIRKAMSLLDGVARQLRGLTQVHVSQGYAG